MQKNVLNKMARFCFFTLISTLAGMWAGVVVADTRLNTQQMSQAEFEAAGLHKLSPEELASLNAWLAQTKSSAGEVQASAPMTPAPQQLPQNSQPEPQTTAEERFGREQVRKRQVEKDVPESITSRLIGEFRGWDGNTVFRLENGQVWRQRIGGRYRSPKKVNPEVVIEKGRFGYYLRLADKNRSIGVARVR